MQKVKLYNKKNISGFISPRNGEVKLGEEIELPGRLEDLEKTEAKFVIFGIPEDIGVRANFGKPGTANAWKAFLSAFLNVQHNSFLKGKDLLLLGEIDTSEEMQKASNIDPSDPNYHVKLGDLVGKIDEKLIELVEKIVGSGKIPVVIGGGHNNAYGNICGSSKALRQPLNVINIDAHTDLRKTDYRHSGNGFSYARKNGFLNKYSVFGLQQNYTPQYIFEDMKRDERIDFSLFEELPGQRKVEKFSENLNFVKEDFFGCEIDCDSIANFPSSAISPSGLDLDDVRKMVVQVAKEPNCSYLHICEGIPANTFPTGKAISYLVTDFIKNKIHA